MSLGLNQGKLALILHWPTGIYAMLSAKNACSDHAPILTWPSPHSRPPTGSPALSCSSRALLRPEHTGKQAAAQVHDREAAAAVADQALLIWHNNG